MFCVKKCDDEKKVRAARPQPMIYFISQRNRRKKQIAHFRFKDCIAMKYTNSSSAAVRIPRRAILSWIAIISLLCLSNVSAELRSGNKKNKQDEQKIAKVEIDRFISLATSYLVRISHTAAQDPDNVGKFTYEANLGWQLETDFQTNPQKTYNLLRHNGAIYSLGLSYKRQESPKALDAMIRSVDYLKHFAIKPVPDENEIDKENGKQNDDFQQFTNFVPDLLAAWEIKKVTPTTDSPVAKLGGAGLALIALVSLEQIQPGHSELSYLRKLAQFIVSMQKDDGSFTSRYFPTDGGKDDSWTSLYYPGEAALGLVYLSSIETDETLRKKWIARATMALLYLERYRRNQDLDEIEPDHWALLATAQLLPLLDDKSKEYWLVYDHAVKVAKSMLSAFTFTQLRENMGCMTLDRRTCPTATRLEGLIAAMSFVRKDERFFAVDEKHVSNLKERMMEAIEISIKFLMDSQEVNDSFSMHGGVPLRFPVKSDEDKVVRVDYVQHAMSAIMAYEELLKSQKRGRRILKAATKLIAEKKEHLGSGGTYAFLAIMVLLLGIVLYSLFVKPFLRRPNKSKKGE